ncbi:hypothetical protein DUT90_09765 [Polaribacter sp. WD7]|uniref:hypothetical protein n=1 Tax=Polaribacter sp. WD7 TaxID=2269061 RepID=UPI000DF44264|nr:hypothetical protein [Polaribacter sp. WD7]RCS26055.1 hypothetical protein DUT90_09765 [Polaribacter sp. WD7]
MVKRILKIGFCLLIWTSTAQAQKVFKEKNGFLKVEAEGFYKQTNDELRKWYVVDKRFKTTLQDADASHAQTASKRKYIEILPDTRQTHKDKLIQNENFSNVPGIAVVHYKVRIQNPGRYYVWVKAFSTGSEDNGVHVGLNGKWPNSGKRLQWCKGKRSWYWESKQRTKAEHCGIENAIYLDIKTAGEHDIQFSMREDGFEMDEWLITKDKNYNPRTEK